MDGELIPNDTSCRAIYADGFTLDETEHGDASPYDENANVFHAILNHRPEAEHGRLVKFMVFWHDHQYELELPEDATPIRFRHGYCRMTVDGSLIESGWSGLDFGYELDGVPVVTELR